MQQDGRAFTKEDLITEVISKNIPSTWVKDFVSQATLKKPH
jgi:hypothetical protein